MSIQLFDRASSQAEQEQMTPEQRYMEYMSAFATIDPTEGVPTPFKLASELHWPTIPEPSINNPDDAAEDGTKLLASKGIMGFKILVESLHMAFNPETEDAWVKPASLRAEQSKSVSKLPTKESSVGILALATDVGALGLFDEEGETDESGGKTTNEESAATDVGSLVEKENIREEEEVKDSVEKAEQLGEEEKDDDVRMDEAAE